MVYVFRLSSVTPVAPEFLPEGLGSAEFVWEGDGLCVGRACVAPSAPKIRPGGRGRGRTQSAVYGLPYAQVLPMWARQLPNSAASCRVRIS